ncbi:MAG: magnesium-dependent phosphatase-1 [Verrucomicrobiales bacterium]|nr:magnesium-dependent phosphatase-1 [Verrucomicrobiales bacterium]
MAQPGLIVFDLDFTLWDCGGLWVDCTSYPFRKNGDGTIVDSDGRVLRLYEDALDIIGEIEASGIPVGLASRTERPDWAVDLLELMGIRERCDYEEIYPGSKVTHFRRLAEDSGLTFEEMLFFDDERRNIVEVGALGVTCVEVKNGINRAVFEDGLAQF